MTTYSTVLKLELPGDGQQVGTWGQTTNKNFGTLVEQAITGVRTISMLDADYVLSDLNGTTDEARNAVIVASGTNNSVKKIVIPLNNKCYTISNQTVGGYAINVGASTGNYVTIPNGTTTLVYCDGTNTVVGINGIAGAFYVSGALTVAGNASVTGNTSLTGTLGVGGAASFTNTVGFSVTPTAPTQATGTNTTQLATTAFVQASTTALGLGTMSTQNANNVNITGGVISGLTSLASGTGSFSGNLASLGSVSGASGIFGAVSGTTGTFSSTISGTTITASAQFSGPGTGLTGTAASLTSGATNSVASGGTIASNVTATTQAYGTNNTTVATTAFAIANGIPSGAIVMWSGSIASVPSGWALCNGSNGTPNLLDRFVVAAGSAYAVGATGGSANATLVAHTHTGTTATNGEHTHTTSTLMQCGGGCYTGVQPGGYGGNYDARVQVLSAGSHNHTFTTDSSGSSATNANLPPYYALAYIMKL